MDRSNSVPKSNRLMPPSQPISQRLIGAPNQFSNSQLKFVNDLVQQQPPSQRQAVNQQLEQLTPEEINEIQRKLENGEILHGLSSLPEGANMTHKFIVKVRKHNNQPQQLPQPQIAYQPQPLLQPNDSNCPNCPHYEQKLRQQDYRIEQLLGEMNRMSQFLADKSNEIEIWKKQYLAIQQELSKPKTIDNSDKYIREIQDLKYKLQEKEHQLNLNETTIKQLQENQIQPELELHAGNPNNYDEINQLNKELEEARQDNELYQGDIQRLTQKIQNLEYELRNKKSEITTIYKSDPETERQLIEIRNQYTRLQSQYNTLQETSKIVQKEIQYETKVIYQPDPETENKLQIKIKQLEELNQKYMQLQREYTVISEKQKTSIYESKTIYKPDPESERQLQLKVDQYNALISQFSLLQQKYNSLEEKSKVVQKEIQYETKIVYQPDPETEHQLQLKIDQYNSLQQRYSQLQTQYYSLEEKSKIVQKEIQYETKVVYKPDPETEHQLQLKIDQYNSLQQRYSQLQTQYYSLEEKSKIVQKEIQYETKIVYQPDPETERQLLLKQQQLDSITSKNTILQQQIESINIQIQQYQTQIFQFQTKSNDSQKYILQIDKLTEEISKKNQELESLKRKISILEQNSDQINTLQYKVRELEQLLNQREDRIRSLSIENSNYQSQFAQYQITIENVNNLKEQIAQWRSKCDQMEQRQKQITSEEITQWRGRYDQLEQRYISLQQSYETIQITLNEYKDNEQSDVLQLEIKRLQKTIIELRSEIDRLLVQASDNQWLSKRYEEQQILIEQYKAQLEERQSIQKEYTYEITNPIKRSQIIETQKQVIQTSTYNETQKSLFPTIQTSSQQIEYTNIQPKFYNDQHLLKTNQSVTIAELKRSRGEQDFSSQRWNSNFQSTIQDVRIEKNIM